MLPSGEPCRCRAGKALAQHKAKMAAAHDDFKQCTATANQEALQRRHSASIPPKYGRYSIEGLKTAHSGNQGAQKAIQAAEWYIANGYVPSQTNGNKHSVLLHGPCGCGKTSLAFEIAKARIAERCMVLATPWASLYNRIKAEYKRDGNAEQIVQDAARVDFLMLDDLGAFVGDSMMAASSDQQGRFKSILEHRIWHGLPTVITSNMTIAQIQAVWGEPIGGRIFEEFALIEMSGRDLRKGAVA